MELVQVIGIYSVGDLLTTKDHRDTQQRGRAEREASGGRKKKEWEKMKFQNKREEWMFAIIAGSKKENIVGWQSTRPVKVNTGVFKVFFFLFQ